jgi:2-keto-4-pentenoate hydratase/2-oxohepta-3-ene-1,7-dioic acid hydratase in catechol pathway
VRFANLDGRGAIVRGDDAYDIAALSNDTLPADPMQLLTSHLAVVRQLADADLPAHHAQPLSASRLGPPVPAPRAIFGLVANYPPAVLTDPAVPMVFGKFPSAVTGPFDDIRLPVADRLPMGKEWTVLEAELAVVIGKGGHRIAACDALDRVAGFTVAQDITERVHELGPRGTSVGTMEYESLKALGKSLDTFCPLGPVLVTLDELDDPNALELECRLNGAVVQKATTSDLLMGVAALLEFLSAFVTLRAGDVVLTGTPTPVGGQLPRLSPGDVIETEIRGIGTMRNTCVVERA